MTTKKTPTRIYCVKSTAEGAKPRLVRATHPSTALRHVAEAVYTVDVATQDELVDLLAAGSVIEQIKHEQQQLT